MTHIYSLKRLFSCLIKREDGVAAMEFGFAAPVVLLMVIGAFEIGYSMFAQSVLNSAAREAARQGITGYVPCDMTREEYIQAVIDRSMQSFVDDKKRTIKKRVYHSFSDIGKPEDFVDENGNKTYDNGEPFTDMNGNNQWDSDMASAGLGGPGDVVVYDISYKLNTLTGFFADAIGSNGILNISATTAVRNEPASISLSNTGQCSI